MKKTILFLFAIFFYATLFACDVCGNGGSGLNLGTVPSLSKDFIGLRCRYASFVSHQGGGRLFKTAETFITTELWYRKQVAERWQAMAFVPYHFNQQKFQNGLPDKTLNGLGDVLLTAGYRLWKKDQTVETNLLQHQLWLNAGVKLPTGKHAYKKDGSEVANANFQLGSGSTDALLSALYSLRWNAAGLTADVSVRKNTANKNGYGFGDRFATNLYLFYSKAFGGVKLIPLAGMSVDVSAMDNENKMRIYETGGTLLSANAGLNLAVSKFVAGLLWQAPVKQNLGSGHLKARNFGMIQVSCLL